MNIHTVRDNLKNTIAGKEQMLAYMNEHRVYASEGQVMAHNATVEFLKINIDELKRLLQDVGICCEQASEQSWALNPDRSGGQFTQDEIYNSSRDGWIEP